MKMLNRVCCTLHYIYENVIIAAVRFVTDRITPVKYSHIFIVKKGRVLVSQTVQTENKMGIMPTYFYVPADDDLHARAGSV